MTVVSVFHALPCTPTPPTSGASESQHCHVCLALYSVGRAPTWCRLSLHQPQLWSGVNPGKVCLESLLFYVLTAPERKQWVTLDVGPSKSTTKSKMTFRTKVGKLFCRYSMSHFVSKSKVNKIERTERRQWLPVVRAGGRED